MFEYIQKDDPEIYEAMLGESDREEYGLELIASENYVSRAVMEAAGSLMTNKYAEGYPHKRYYGGCEFVDIAEELAINRAKKLFGAEHVNVQPHSGSQANMGAYLSVLTPGDKILGMDLTNGGHLTHGSPVNFSGQLFEAHHYGLNPETEQLDYNQIEDIAKKEKPKMIVCGASAYSRDIDFSAFRKIADSVGALLLADIAHVAGLVATKLHSDPIPYCDFVTTTTHKTLRGPRGGMIMCREEFAKGVNKKIFPGIQGGPLMHVIAAKAVAFKEALDSSYKEYCSQVIKNAKVIGETLGERGFKIVSGGTDNHLLLVDLTDKDITGKDAENALEAAAITVNKNTVPNESRSPFITSGLRIGTPAMTTRGMKEKEMMQIANWIADVVDNISNESMHKEIKGNVKSLCESFPLYKTG